MEYLSIQELTLLIEDNQRSFESTFINMCGLNMKLQANLFRMGGIALHEVDIYSLIGEGGIDFLNKKIHAYLNKNQLTFQIVGLIMHVNSDHLNNIINFLAISVSEVEDDKIEIDDFNLKTGTPPSQIILKWDEFNSSEYTIQNNSQ